MKTKQLIRKKPDLSVWQWNGSIVRIALEPLSRRKKLPLEIGATARANGQAQTQCSELVLEIRKKILTVRVVLSATSVTGFPRHSATVART